MLNTSRGFVGVFHTASHWEGASVEGISHLVYSLTGSFLFLYFFDTLLDDRKCLLCTDSDQQEKGNSTPLVDFV